MTFSETLIFVAGLLSLEKRVSYLRLRKEFQLDEETLELLRHELIVKRLALDDNGQGLVTTGTFASQAGGELPPDSVSHLTEPVGLHASPRQLIDVATSSSVSKRSPTAGATKSEAERRQLTVMFCDLVGSTALSTALDPEDLREVITTYQDACREAIARYDGFIARYMGDGILVYFGYPQAHENDAERAVRAGLDVLAAVPQVSAKAGARHAVEVAVRVGVATGPVVVGDIIGEGAAEEAAVVGETPNLAARLEGVAEPGQLAIGPGTHRLVGQLFEFQDLGQHELKGITEPVQVWHVMGERAEDDASSTERRASRAPLVGRQEEIGLLVRAWEGAQEGRGQVVLIQGEAGVGKSRLIDALRDSVAESAHTWISARASPYHTASPLYPVAEQVKRALDWQVDDSAETRLEKLEQGMSAQTDFALEELVRLFAMLLSLDLPEGRYPPLDMTPNALREATLDAVSAWVLALTEKSPVLLAWEDLHWADPTTVALLGLMLDQVPTAPILMVGTYRPDFVPPWPARTHMIPITLGRLERVEVEAIATNLAGGKALPESVLEHLVNKADGVPLYVEELTKTILESELLREEGDRYRLDGTLAELDIPSTLQDSLMARLDRAPGLREVAQMAAVLGREFTYEMLSAVIALEETVLQSGLEQLVANELVYQRGRGRRARYTFKHALIQDAAYESLLNRTRQHYHQQVADLILSSYPAIVEEQPELIAYHLSHAGAAERAVPYWQTAGRNALQTSADAEAIVHLRQGLSELEGLPSSPERDHTELQLLTALGPAFIAIKGFGADDVRDTYARAHAVCARVGSKAEEFLILRGLFNSSLFSARIDDCLKQGNALLEVSRNLDDGALEVEARRVMATVSVVRGDFPTAVEHAEAGLTAYDPERHRALAFVYGADPQVVCGLYAALSLWALGQPGRAEATMHTAVERANALAHGHTLAFALAFQAMLDHLRHDVGAARESAEQAVSEASKGGIRQWQDWSRVVLGWAQAMEGDLENGLAVLDEGLDEWPLWDSLMVPWFLGQRVEVLCRMQRLDEAFAGTRDAIALAEEGPQGFYLAELHRLQGEILVGQPNADRETAESAVRRAIGIARSQQAKGFELRALASLVQLRNGRNDELEARTWLAECYGSFTEGFDSVDLRAAKALLDGSAAAAS